MCKFPKDPPAFLFFLATLPGTNSSTLKIGAWETNFFLGVSAHSEGRLLLVFGGG